MEDNIENIQKINELKNLILTARNQNNFEEEKQHLNILEINISLELMDQDKLLPGRIKELEFLLTETRLRLKKLGQNITESVEVTEIKDAEDLANGGEPMMTCKTPFQVKTSGGDVFHISFPPPNDKVTGCQVPKSLLKTVLKGPDDFGNDTNSTNIQSTQAVLMYGLPGNGKTLLASWLSGEMETAFIKADGSRLLSKWLGQTNTVFMLFY